MVRVVRVDREVLGLDLRAARSGCLAQQVGEALLGAYAGCERHRVSEEGDTPSPGRALHRELLVAVAGGVDLGRPLPAVRAERPAKARLAAEVAQRIPDVEPRRIAEAHVGRRHEVAIGAGHASGRSEHEREGERAEEEERGGRCAHARDPCVAPSPSAGAPM